MTVPGNTLGLVLGVQCPWIISVVWKSLFPVVPFSRPGNREETRFTLLSPGAGRGTSGGRLVEINNSSVTHLRKLDVD